MDVDTIWQTRLQGPLTHCVTWDLWTRGRGNFGQTSSAISCNCLLV